MKKDNLLIILFLIFLSKSFLGQSSAEISTKIIHVAVALCDNNQHIARVPAQLGNGKDPKNNLYWGALYGVKTFLKNSENWEFIKSTKKLNDQILERVVFKHKIEDCYLVADAYNGDFIYQTIKDVINFTAGQSKQKITTKNKEYFIKSGSDLMVYVGHNGMLDFDFPEFKYPKKTNQKQMDAMVLACYSNCKFEKPFSESNTNFVLGTNGLVAPEAYILEYALEAWLKNKSKKEIEIAAASAYAKYQKISKKAANRIFATAE